MAEDCPCASPCFYAGGIVVAVWDSSWDLLWVLECKGYWMVLMVHGDWRRLAAYDGSLSAMWPGNYGASFLNCPWWKWRVGGVMGLAAWYCRTVYGIEYALLIGGGGGGGSLLCALNSTWTIVIQTRVSPPGKSSYGAQG